MKIHLHVHIDGPVHIDGMDAVVAHLIHIEEKLDHLTATAEEFTNVLNRIDEATTNIAGDLRDLRDQLTNAGLPADVEASVLARLTETADKLEAIAADPEAPVPEA